MNSFRSCENAGIAYSLVGKKNCVNVDEKEKNNGYIAFIIPIVNTRCVAADWPRTRDCTHCHPASLAVRAPG